MGKLPEHYSLKSDNEKDFEIMDERDGQSFKVAKKGIHPARQISIMRMKKYAEGGAVDPMSPEYQMMLESQQTLPVMDDRIAPSAVPDTMARGLVNTIFPGMQNPTDPVAQGAPAPPMPPEPVLAANEPMVVAPMVSPGAEVPQAPIAQQPTISAPKVGGNIGEAGLRQEASGLQEQAKQTAQIYDKYVQAEQERAKVFSDSLKQYQTNADELSQQIAASKVNPDQYWGSKDTGSKISAAIGVALAGIGQGLMGTGSNAAMDFINKQIDRDIDAQKTELGKRQNMFSDNLKLQGNMMAAESATRAQMSSILQGQMAKMAAQTNSPIIMGQMQQKIDQLRRQQMLDLATVAKNQASQVPMPHGAGPEMAALSRVPPALRENALKEVGKYKQIQNALGQIDGVMTDLKKINSASYRTQNPVQYQYQLKAAKLRLFPLVKQVVGEKMSEPDVQNMVNPMIGSLWESQATADKKTGDFKKLLVAQIPGETPTLSAYGGFDPVSALSQQSAPETKRGKDGRTYKKVEGGWVPIK